MRIVITGCAGFIGSHLTHFLLKKKYKVVGIDNLSWGKKEFIAPYLNLPNFTFIKLDLLDKKELFRRLNFPVDTIFHLAANSDIARSSNLPEIDFRNTTITTFNLLEAMRLKKIRKFFFTSGSGVYGDVGDEYTRENFGPLKPVSMYGATKLSSEAMISAYANLFDMKAWILRPANIVGPNATHGVTFDFINKLKKNPKKLTILGDGKQSKSYLYISDVISAINVVWKKAKEKVNIYNLSSTSFITVSEIAHVVLKEMGLKNTSLHYTGGTVGWKGDVPIVRINIDKIKKLGWKPQYSSKQAVIKTVRALLGKKT